MKYGFTYIGGKLEHKILLIQIEIIFVWILRFYKSEIIDLIIYGQFIYFKIEIKLNLFVFIMLI